MNLKSIMTGAAIAATVVTASVVASAPAQAMSIDYSSSTLAKLTNLGSGNFLLDFAPSPNVTLVSSPSPAFGTNGGSLSFADLSLTGTSGGPWIGGPLNDFITGFGAAGNFDLTSFTLTQTIFNGTPFFLGNFAGIFDGTNVAATGTFDTSGLAFLTTGKTFSGEIIPVPTPALLPGLVGLGVAALRKRKGEGAEKETVGVKA
jgi:hypothetical protein